MADVTRQEALASWARLKGPLYTALSDAERAVQHGDTTAWAASLALLSVLADELVGGLEEALAEVRRAEWNAAVDRAIQRHRNGQ